MKTVAKRIDFVANVTHYYIHEKIKGKLNLAEDSLNSFQNPLATYIKIKMY